MENKYLDFCNKHKINDGVLREMLYSGHTEEALKAIDEAVIKRKNELDALYVLSDMVSEDQE